MKVPATLLDVLLTPGPPLEIALAPLPLPFPLLLVCRFRGGDPRALLWA